MILETVDQGWGPEHVIKQIEMEVTRQYLRPIHQDCVRTVVINSCWFDQDLLRTLQQRFHHNPPDRIVLISMLDAAIVQPDHFSNLGCDIRCVGYYPGADYIDFWSLVVDRHMSLPDLTSDNHAMIDTAFMCLNRKPHWHRRRLYQLMHEHDLLSKGLVSMGGEEGQAVRALPQDSGGSRLAPNSGADQHGIVNDIMSLGREDNWRQHFLNVVTETQWDVSGTTFVTEKIYKPILGKRPFLVYAADGAQQWMNEHGFSSYVKDFEDITDLDLVRPENLVPFLQVLCQQPHAYFRHKMIEMSPKISYNIQQFHNHVADQKIKIAKGIQCQT